MREGWEYKKLGDVCDIYQPNTISTEMLVNNGKYYVYGANGIIGKYNEFNHENSEILLTCRGATCGTINISEPYSWINGNAMVIHRKSDSLNFDFLKYLMSSLDYSLIITGAAQPQITRAKLTPVKICIPQLSTQLSIVSELDKITEMISKYDEQLRELDTLSQSIFYEMFGDPVENEKGWEVKKLEEICDKITDGTHLSPKNDPVGDYMYVTAKNIKKDGIIFDNITYVDKETHKCIYSRCNPEYGDVLYIKDGVTTGVATINTVYEEFSLLSSVALLKTSNSIINYYLKYILNMPTMYNNIRSNMGGAAITRLTLVKIKKLLIPLPPLPLQQSFARKVEAIEAMKSKVREAKKEAETLLAARMQYWFE